MAYPIGAAITLDALAGALHPALAELREAEPVSWLPAMGGWLVTDRNLAIEVMRDPETFTVDDPRFSTAQVIGPSMLSLDGAEHGRHRSPWVEPFRAAAVRGRFGAAVRDSARRLVAAVAPEGRGDLTGSVAEPLAVETMALALGLAPTETGEAVAWYEAIVAGVDAVSTGSEVPEVSREAFAALGDRVLRSAEMPGTLLAQVAATGELSGAELVSNAAVLLFGGIVTSAGATASALYHLLAAPDALAEVRADRSLVASAVEESLRLEPAAAVVDRYATREVGLGGAEIAAGDLVRVSLAGANRDPDTFPDPDRFDVRRPNVRQHVAFARGPHACLGIHLARLEIQAALEAVLELLPRARLDPTRSSPPEGLIFRQPGAVWTRWEA